MNLGLGKMKRNMATKRTLKSLLEETVAVVQEAETLLGEAREISTRSVDADVLEFVEISSQFDAKICLFNQKLSALRELVAQMRPPSPSREVPVFSGGVIIPDAH